jgi:hypothetical protein
MSINLSASGTASASASQVWSGASAPMSPNQKMSDLFDQIDTTGSGTISQSQFDQAFQSMNPPAPFQAAGADAVWSKLDPTGSGTVSKQDFVKDMTEMMKQLRGAHHHGGHSAEGAQSAAQSTGLLDALSTTEASSSSSNSTDTVGTVINALA